MLIVVSNLAKLKLSRFALWRAGRDLKPRTFEVKTTKTIII